ncbi:MAG: threonylcarbamoyl-AMP synthase [Magnetococcales bacterium]|nr:threonylcarbamoyl-AMP synthase [Magnetococcales bacterium]NGZ26795.1 threonylcarbamoyl-AMP synthase [Magnetococcales bacterium]
MTLPEAECFHQAVTALQQGKVIAYPTETVYGLGVDPFNEHAVNHLLQLKQRDAQKGLILLIPDLSWVNRLALVSPISKRLMEHFWPGPLTLVLPATPQLPPWLLTQHPTVALRLSPSPVVQHLLSLWPYPLVSTSANLSGQQQLSSPEEIQHLWQNQIAAIIPGQAGNTPSTVVQVGEHDKPSLLRTGVIPFAMIEHFIVHC